MSRRVLPFVIIAVTLVTTHPPAFAQQPAQSTAPAPPQA